VIFLLGMSGAVTDFFVEARHGNGLTHATDHCDFLKVESDFPALQGKRKANRQAPDLRAVEAHTMLQILTEHFRELQSKSAELKRQFGNSPRSKPHRLIK
jgi:hypothetical protein